MKYTFKGYQGWLTEWQVKELLKYGVFYNTESESLTQVQFSYSEKSSDSITCSLNVNQLFELQDEIKERYPELCL